MTDHLAKLPVEEVAQWYRRLADFIQKMNTDACTNKKPCVAHPLAPDMLIKWLDNRDSSTTHHFDAPSHLRTSQKVREALRYHRAVFLTEQKGRIGPKFFSSEKWLGVLPRLQGKSGYRKWVPGQPLSMEFESNVQYGEGHADIVRIQFSGTPQEQDLFTSLRGWSLISKVVVTGQKVSNTKIKVGFANWVCRGRDVYDFSKVKGITLPNPDYKQTFDKAVRPGDKEIKIYHTNAIRLQDAKLAAPYNVVINDWFPADESLKKSAMVDLSRSI